MVRFILSIQNPLLKIQSKSNWGRFAEIILQNQEGWVEERVTVTKVDLMNKGLRRIEQFHGGVSLHVTKVDLMNKGLRP